MIQGVGAGGLGYNPQVEILEKHFACLTFDNRGIGLSQPAGAPITVKQMADDTLALMDREEWPSAHLVGHSMGGLIALELALTAKLRVRSLSLLCTFARGADATRMTPTLLWILLRLKYGSPRLRRQAFTQLVMPPGWTGGGPDSGIAEKLSAVFGQDIGDLPPITAEQLTALRSHDVTPRLIELAGIPTLVISGEKDRMAPPASGRVIAAGIPGSRYVEIAGASHAFPVIDAERCGALLLEHLNEAGRKTLPAATGVTGRP